VSDAMEMCSKCRTDRKGSRSPEIVGQKHSAICLIATLPTPHSALRTGGRGQEGGPNKVILQALISGAADRSCTRPQSLLLLLGVTGPFLQLKTGKSWTQVACL
jgi:hypothetical protein